MTPNKMLVTDQFMKNSKIQKKKKKKRKEEKSIYKLFTLSFSVKLQNSLISNYNQ